MTNFIQLIPIEDGNLYVAPPSLSQPTLSQPPSQSQSESPSQSQSQSPFQSQSQSQSPPSTITADQVRKTPKLSSSTHYFIRNNPAARLALATYEQAPCIDTPAPDSALPNRATCAMPYHTEPGIDRVQHSQNTACRFYVACPARIQGVYHTDKQADEQVKGFRNGKAIAVHFWDDAEEEWALDCLRWHGEVCPNARARVNMETRVHLNPALRDDVPKVERWAVKGIPGHFSSRNLALEAAVRKDGKEIQVLGSSDDAALLAWSKATVIL
ncbi:hypothetical protein C8R47DRAFT_1216461 [Mycena vitilis]|nr:hypothetical protein C8R47DRAFT_1216461 [Mycena vitilis]